MTDKQFYERRATLIQYLRSKINVADWHAVADCANDLRVLEAEWKAYKHVAPLKRAYEAMRDPGVTI